MTSPGALSNNPTYLALVRRVDMLERRFMVANSLTYAAADRTPVKRFRVAVFSTPLILGGGLVTGTVVWSAPMPSEVYNVDAGCSAVLGPLTVNVTSQTADGCTVSFTAPAVIALGSTCVVIGISPAQATTS